VRAVSGCSASEPPSMDAPRCSRPRRRRFALPNSRHSCTSHQGYHHRWDDRRSNGWAPMRGRADRKMRSPERAKASQEIVTATLFDGKATLLVTGIACGAEHPSGQRTHGPRQHHHHPEIPTHAAQRRRRRRHRPGQHPQTQRHLTPHDEAARRVRRTPHTPPLARERDRLAAHRSRSRNLTQTGHLTRPTPMQTPSSKPQADPSSPTSALHPREVAIFAETRASRTGAEPARVCSHRFRPSVPR
jgi:hypothetical protein